MRRIKISERKLTEQALKQRERKVEQLANRPHFESVDRQEDVRLNPKFEEIIDDCKAIKQILQEAEQAASTNPGSFLGGNYHGRARKMCEAGFAFRRKIKQKEKKPWCVYSNLLLSCF